jgi:hypothetical protein
MQVAINISLTNDAIVITSLDNVNLAIAYLMSLKIQKVLKCNDYIELSMRSRCSVRII